MPLPNVAGTTFVNNYTGQDKLSYERDNFDAKVNWQVKPNFQTFAKFSYSPSLIYDGPILGDAGGRLHRRRPARARLPVTPTLATLGGTYTFSPDAPARRHAWATRTRSWVASTISTPTNGLEDMGIPGTNGPDRLQGGIPSFQITNWSNMGNPNTGNPFQFNDKQYVASISLQWVKSSHAFRFGYDYQKPADEPLPAPGRHLPDRARHLPVQRQT